MNDCRWSPALPALALGDLAALVVLRPHVGALIRGGSAPHTWVSEVGADGAAITVAGAALWCVAVWLGAGLLAAVATQLPGSAGRLARTLARALLPAAVYRAVAGAAGLGVLLAPVAALGAVGAGPASSSSITAVTASPIPAPTWPADPPTLPAPGWPTSGPTAPTGAPVPSGATPRPDARRPRSAQPRPTSSAVVVRSGDSLWTIAAVQLGPAAAPGRIAAAWPRWYAVNRAVIGSDPNLIRPGQRLQSPTSKAGPR